MDIGDLGKRKKGAHYPHVFWNWERYRYTQTLLADLFTAFLLQMLFILKVSDVAIYLLKDF